MRQRVLMLAVASVLMTTSCAGDATPEASAPATQESTSVSAAPGSTSAGAGKANAGAAVIKTAASDFGPMLFDESGQAIYLFDKEKTERPECYDACADAWPPVLTKGDPSGTGEVRDELLGTVDRTDGTKQVTYNGHPLYFYAHEGKNEVLCHNVRGFGGLWLVVTPRGDAAPA